MIPAQFDYVRPAAMDEALQILADREGEAKVLSGGYSLLPLLKLRLASPTLLVDIQDLDGLDKVIETEDGLRIGGRATHRRIHESPAVQARHPLLLDAAGGIGDPQVRNWGTIGGSCAHADPSSDWPAVLIATRATIFVRSLSGERSIAARDFFLDTFQTAIEPTELLTEVLIPNAPKPSGEAYAKLEPMSASWPARPGPRRSAPGCWPKGSRPIESPRCVRRPASTWAPSRPQRWPSPSWPSWSRSAAAGRHSSPRRVRPRWPETRRAATSRPSATTSSRSTRSAA